MTGALPDLARMRRERAARLRTAMAAHDVEILLLATGRNVEYATGVGASLEDDPIARRRDRVALVAGDETGHLLDVAIDDPPAHAARAVERVTAMSGGRRRVGVDECTVALLSALESLSSVTVVDAGPVMRRARLHKTGDEVACIRRAQEINERAIGGMREQAVPGSSEEQLTTRFIALARELGATASVVEPVWQSVTGECPLTRFGQPAYPAPSRDRALSDGDVLWVDTGVGFDGYSSDLGRTWHIGSAAARQHRADFERWREVTDSVLTTLRPGVTGRDLVAAARSVADTPWLRHLYLAHGLGQHSSESPRVGTERGLDDDAVLEAGMVVVLEPVIHHSTGGYRAEEVVLITDTGFEMLSERISDADT